ncbi:hypothetical protein GCM10009554_56910 [Kribbella koreensis]|uniref:Tachylectin n=1 Tax=Kribbella koreensis TaxID=57909 RepID=A0ABN1R7Q2_9ACTN
MKLQRFALALAGAGLFAATAVSGTAVAADPNPSVKSRIAALKQQAAAKAVAEPCSSLLGGVTANGAVNSLEILPGKPPKVEPWFDFKFYAAKATGTWYLAQNASGSQLYYYGVFIQAGNLYRHTTYINQDTGAVTPKIAKVGGGWASFKTIATSNYSITAPRHAYIYGLNANGKLYRYSQVGTAVKSLGNFAGFTSFKALTVVSETPTYDTLLMTTTAGALYTVRIPVAASTKPVLKLVRKTGFAAYEALTAHNCGVRGGTLIVGIDHDTDSAYQYAFSKFNGTATAITAYGKAPAVLSGVTTAPFTTHYDQLVGE